MLAVRQVRVVWSAPRDCRLVDCEVIQRGGSTEAELAPAFCSSPARPYCTATLCMSPPSASSNLFAENFVVLGWRKGVYILEAYFDHPISRTRLVGLARA